MDNKLQLGVQTHIFYGYILTYEQWNKIVLSDENYNPAETEMQMFNSQNFSFQIPNQGELHTISHADKIVGIKNFELNLFMTPHDHSQCGDHYGILGYHIGSMNAFGTSSFQKMIEWENTQNKHPQLALSTILLFGKMFDLSIRPSEIGILTSINKCMCCEDI